MLGGVGACLILLGVISTVLTLARFAFPDSLGMNLAYSLATSVIGILALVGFVLFFIAMYGLSKDYNEHRIFDYVLYGLIITIVAAVIAGLILIVYFFTNLASIFPNLNVTPSSPQINSTMLSALAPFLGVFGFITLINIVFNVLALNLLASKTQVRLFRTTAKVFLAGAVVQIAAGIVFAVWASSGSVSLDTIALVSVPGGLVQYIAWALLAKAFFTINVPPTQTGAPSNVYGAVTGQVKYCPYCGAQNTADTIYCVQCGKKQ
jgi:uncharacterized membrane protein